MPKKECPERREVHTYLVKLECRRCGRNVIATMTRRCMAPKAKIRSVGCEQCNNTVNMAFYCAQGQTDSDWTRHHGWEIRSTVKNIDEV